MSGYDPFLLGAYCFMRSLFLGCICICVFSYIVNKIIHIKYFSIFITSLFFCMLVGVKSYLGIDIPFFSGGGYPEIMGGFFIGVGYLIKNTKLNILLNATACPLFSSVIFVVAFLIHPSSLKTSSCFGDWGDIIFSGTSGFFLVYYLSKILRNRRIGRLIASLGRNSFYVLTFHFLMFKPISLLKVYLFGLNPLLVGCHPVLFFL